MSKEGTEIDPNPLVDELLAKTKGGKLKWEPTVDREAFLVSVGGETTLKLHLTYETGADEFGNLDSYQVPALTLLDAKGKTLWTIPNGRVNSGLWPPLYKVVQRVANQVDDASPTFWILSRSYDQPQWPGQNRPFVAT